ncbi:sulfite exporter TauE/SafE family protein [Geitlerinema sp. P-1104]|uniref:urease accessory protein UreH domain-containing protein n=1 Tax=Geitlerinema sp. P-1104 TaxID=2546230 RepID=UPI00147692F9|nr:sulfite exporter TauE/SafE family protein [Geitlerinema sp. P-1104]NMG59117.1 sulfite exporter TauE/SafE family protein [Geitlerinema sp. P-1104]
MPHLTAAHLLELLPLTLLGFLGSFGHCVGMCGPLTVAFSLGQQHKGVPWRFHLLLNLGRVLSYASVGVLLGTVSSTLVAGGQLAGVGSWIRQAIVIFTGLLLIFLGLRQINPESLPNLPLLHPLKGTLHDRLSRIMNHLSFQNHGAVPLLLGICWGLIPCGFLYAAQLKAAETGDPLLGGLAMAAFGLGTAPMMMGVGLSVSRLSANRRSQLFRLGGWVTLSIGILTLLRTDAMVDLTGHGALLLLMLALAARPLRPIWPSPLRYRRAIGVGAYVLVLAHLGHMLDHSLDWNLGAIAFLMPRQRWALWAGISAFILMTPAALSSSDRAQRLLGQHWRRLHSLTRPALVLATLHGLTLGSHYLGTLSLTWDNWLRSLLLLGLSLSVFGLRGRIGKKLLTRPSRSSGDPNS